MSKTIKEKLIEQIECLPGHRLQEVLDFVAYLKTRERPRPEGSEGEGDPILKVAGCLSGESLGPAEIEEEMYGGGTT